MTRLKSLVAAAAVSAGLLTGGTAQAAFVYVLDGTDADGLPDFVLTRPSLISVTTRFALSDFDSISLPAGVTVNEVEIADPLNAPDVNFITDPGSFGFFWDTPNSFTGPGTYCAGILGCSNTAAVMTIRETDAAPVPTPATLALLSLGLAGLALRRRR